MTDEAGREVARRIAAVRGRIDAACGRAGRDPASVTLVAVTKGWPPETVARAWEAGIRDFGENRVQEGALKVGALAAAGLRPTWHLIGNLQTNKARLAVRTFDILHAVDSERLLRTIAAAAASPVRMMIEVNISGEAAKHGIAPVALPSLLEAARQAPLARVEGLMTVAPLVADPEESRPVFRRLSELGREYRLPYLSMGMTGDFEVAVEEGATHVRVGRALFGGRPA